MYSLERGFQPPVLHVHERLVRRRVDGGPEDAHHDRQPTAYLTGGTWSPTRPGVFFTIKADGEMDVWDYYYKQDDPTLPVKVTGALTSFACRTPGW